MDNLNKAVISTLLLLSSPFAFSAVAVDDTYTLNVQQTNLLYFYPDTNDDVDSGFTGFTDQDVASWELIQGEGQLELSSDGPTFEPAAGYSGIAIINYTITDNDSTDQASIYITVEDSTASFQAIDDTFEVPENADTTPLNVRQNDQPGHDIVPSANLEIASQTTSQGGSVMIDTINDIPTITYTPPPNFTGTDTFNYSLKRGNDSSTATVTVYVGVEPPNSSTTQKVSALDVITNACQQGSDTLPCAEIANLSLDQQKKLEEQASGRHTKLQSRTMRQMLELQTSNIGSRLREIRDERNQISIDGLNLAIMGENVPLAQALQGNLRGGSAGDGEFASPWGVFINGNISIGKSKETDTRPSYDQDGYGLTLGLDYRFSDTAVLGAAAGLSKYDTDFTSMQGHQDAQSFSLISFGNYYPLDNLYIDGFTMWTQGDLDINRRIDVATVQQDLSSNTNSRQLTAATSVGYEFSHQRWQSTLYGRLEYSDLNIDGYTETGGSMALKVKEQNTHSLISALGTRVGYTFSWSRGVLVPSVELEYIKESSKNYNISNKFASAVTAGSFSISADEPDTEYMNLATSISAVFSGGNSAFIRYETLLLQDSYDFSSYSVGFRTEF